MDDCWGIACAADGGFLLVGESFHPDSTGSGDVYLVRTDSVGNPCWQRHFGGPRVDWAGAVASIPGGGWYVAGGSNSWTAGPPTFADGYILRLDDSGDTLWTRTFGSEGEDEFYTVLATPDGGCLAVGETARLSFPHAFVVRLTPLGDTLWTWVGLDHSSEAWDAAMTTDGGAVITGSGAFTSATWDTWLAKLAADGTLLWSRTFPKQQIVAFAVQETTDQSLLLVGVATDSSETVSVGALMRTDRDGDSLWTRHYPHSWYRNERFWAAVAQPDGGFILIGNFDPADMYDTHEVLLLRTDSVGTESWSTTLNRDRWEYSVAAVGTAEGGLAIAGVASQPGLGQSVLADPLWSGSHGNFRTARRTADGIHAKRFPQSLQ